MRNNIIFSFVGIIISTILLLNTGCKESEPGSIAVCFLTKMSILNDGVTTQAFEFSYENNILNQVTEDGDDNNYNTYIYDNSGRIITVNNFVNGEKKSGIKYTYDGYIVNASYGQYSNVGVWTSDDWNEVYEFNTDGLLLKKEIHTKNDSSVWVIESYDLYEWINRNISQKEHWVLKPEKSSYDKYSTTTYQYDDKNNPFSSAQILKFGEYTNNNALKEEFTLESSGEKSTLTYTYEYSNENYPTKSEATNSDNETFVTKYEHNCI